MAFHEIRRQQFLGEQAYRQTLAMWDGVIAGQRQNLLEPENGEHGWHLSMDEGIAGGLFIQLMLNYTAGNPIEPLRAELEEVISAYERYGEHLWRYTGDRNEVVFKFYSLDEYCQLMQLIGLCFLLHRRDLLPRLAALQDGENRANVGSDWLVEEFMSYVLGDRLETEHVCAVRPYEPLIDAMSSETNEEAIKDMDRYLKRWYKDLAGTGWHDSHKEDGSGYYGYWSFEAGAAVMLLGIEDDSSLHKYLYYPKDMVAWARENAERFKDGGKGAPPKQRSNVAANQPCPEAGWWFTPAQCNSRRYFKQGEVMPSVGGDYGATFWQWSPDQSAPTL